ncbi:nucleotidyltransferase domain-containing protein [Clostridium sediminicola]|uniref:nucleotidyltransferase domain-containing protein n=1 Tax=Clostridium sediminicola TaxID=3114879 RepID=UPI003D168982
MIELRDIILEKLNEIEENYGVKILYAIESGSRAWGFESSDSDYDVRFIYIHKPEWYLSILDKRDVIELPINDLLDISGWDIRKALVLFRKSNPSLLEWLGSPIMYKQDDKFVEKMRELVNEYFSSKKCIYHYMHMAVRNYREYLQKDIIKIKKYFYVLRPVMACMWVEKYGTQPPTVFQELMNSLNLNEELIREINTLLIRKKQGEEMNEEKQNGIINEFLEDRLNYFDEYVKNIHSEKNSDIDVLDELFREILKEAWY